MTKNLSQYIFGIVCFVLFSFAASPVFACSPSQDAIQLTLADRVDNAPIILVGTVTEGFTQSYGNGYDVIREVELEVEQYLRGEGAAIVHISGFGDGADCLSSVYIGERAIFFVEGNPDTGLDAVYLGVHDATWDASAENIATITAITGESNAPYPLPITTQIMRFVSHYWMWIVTLGLLLLAFAVSPMLMKRLRHPRKAKEKR